MTSIIRTTTPLRRRLLLRPLLLQSHFSAKATTKTTKPKTQTTANTEPKTQTSYTITTPRFDSKPQQQQPSSPKPDLPRPSEVPFQTKVANSVRLIGHVHAPLQFQATPDGNVWAATTLTSSPSSSSSQSLRIPIIFEGDLAHIACLYLKDNDFVFVGGCLRSDLYHLNACEGQNHLQVSVHTLYFVEEVSRVNKSTKGDRQVSQVNKSSKDEIQVSQVNISSKGDRQVSQVNKSSKDDRQVSQVKKSSKDDRQEEKPIDLTGKPIDLTEEGEKDDMDKSWKILIAWKDLLAKPHEWIRLKEDGPKGVTFERKSNGDLIWIDDSTPEWIQQKLDSVTFDEKSTSDSSETSLKKDGDSTLGSWRDLLDNPKEWRDYRDSKLKGLVKPNHPDFKRKDGGHPIWLNKAPQWIFSELKGLEFDVQIQNSKKVKESTGDDSWKDLVENPAKWWDNRLGKRNVKAPDFKHKETGEALWLSSSPSWVLPKLPPFKTQKEVTIENTETPA